MLVNQNKNSNNPADKTFTPAESGNASNPTPHDEKMEPSNDNQLLDKKAEKYLREVASTEDYPDAQDEQEAENTIKNENKGE